jgi:hypothetical protein
LSAGSRRQHIRGVGHRDAQESDQREQHEHESGREAVLGHGVGTGVSVGVGDGPGEGEGVAVGVGVGVGVGVDCSIRIVVDERSGTSNETSFDTIGIVSLSEYERCTVTGTPRDRSPAGGSTLTTIRAPSSGPALRRTAPAAAASSGVTAATRAPSRDAWMSAIASRTTTPTWTIRSNAMSTTGSVIAASIVA